MHISTVGALESGYCMESCLIIGRALVTNDAQALQIAGRRRVARLGGLRGLRNARFGPVVLFCLDNH